MPFSFRYSLILRDFSSTISAREALVTPMYVKGIIKKKISADNPYKAGRRPIRAKHAPTIIAKRKSPIK